MEKVALKNTGRRIGAHRRPPVRRLGWKAYVDWLGEIADCGCRTCNERRLYGR